MNDLFETTTTSPSGPEPDPAPETLMARRAARRERQRIRRRRRIRSLVVLTVALAVVAALGVWAYPRVMETLAGDAAEETLTDYPGPGGEEIRVRIPEGASGAEMAAILQEEGVVATRDAFVEAFNGNPNAGGIQPGAYDLRLEMPAADAVAALLDPVNRAELQITIPEGFAVWQVYERIAGIPELGVTAEDVAEIAETPEAIGLPEEARGEPEGWFAPATYDFDPDADVETILSTMVERTVDRLDERGVPAEERQEILTIASIIEREVNIDEYRGQVARVIYNRLETDATGGHIQMDSTTNYGLGQTTTGGLTRDQLNDEDNEYSTHAHAGLPPTPIGSPGAEAIEAALQPDEGDWLFFVTVNLETGETRFAETNAEHEDNIDLLAQWCDENDNPYEACENVRRR